MIIENGLIRFAEDKGKGVDPETGYAGPSCSPQWGEPIPCQYYPNSVNRLAKTSTGEPYTSQSYTILIDDYCAECPGRVQLLECRDNEETLIGDFPVRSVENLSAVGQIKITV